MHRADREEAAANPYAPPSAVPPEPPLPPRPPLLKVALAYGTIGTLTAMLLSITLGPRFFDLPLELRHLAGPWAASAAASFAVPTLVHALFGRRCWSSRAGRVLLGLASVVCAV